MICIIRFSSNEFIFITFGTCTTCKQSIIIIKKSDWDFDIFIRSEVSWIHLSYFYGDECIYVCNWVNTIAVNGEFDSVQIWYIYYCRLLSYDCYRIWWVYTFYTYTFFYRISRNVFKALRSVGEIHLKCILMMLQYIK